jgi:dolichol-phosphate mannosyltransferase
MKKLLSIVIPAFNEEPMIRPLTHRLTSFMNSYKEFDFEVIFVDDGSRDNTARELIKARTKDKRFKIVEMSKNNGCDESIFTGLSFAKGEAVIVMMADLQEPPELIPRFVKEWQNGYDIVYGVVKKRVNHPFHRRIGTFIFYKIIAYLTDNIVPQNVSDFRLLDKTVYKTLASFPEHNKFFRGLAMWPGFKKIGIPFDRPDRIAGKSKANIKLTFRVAINGILGFSSLPLRLSWIVFLLSVGITLLSFFLVSLEQTLFSLLFTLLFFVAAMQSEYILRIFTESRNRPNHIVKKLYGL